MGGGKGNSGQAASERAHKGSRHVVEEEDAIVDFHDSRQSEQDDLQRALDLSLLEARKGGADRGAGRGGVGSRAGFGSSGGGRKSSGARNSASACEASRRAEDIIDLRFPGPIDLT